MSAADESTSEFTITATCTITDPGERKRRLAEAYGLILGFGRQKKVAAQVALADAAHSAS